MSPTTAYPLGSVIGSHLIENCELLAIQFNEKITHTASPAVCLAEDAWTLFIPIVSEFGNITS